MIRPRLAPGSKYMSMLAGVSWRNCFAMLENGVIMCESTKVVDLHFTFL